MKQPPPKDINELFQQGHRPDFTKGEDWSTPFDWRKKMVPNKDKTPKSCVTLLPMEIYKGSYSFSANENNKVTRQQSVTLCCSSCKTLPTANGMTVLLQS
jgi:hypothetical protein